MGYEWTIYLKDGGFTRCPDELLQEKLREHQGSIKEIRHRSAEEKAFLNGKSWREFRETGLLWFANIILHMFGWALVVNVEDDGSISDAYPARTKFRGFSEKFNDEGYQKVSKYLLENIAELEKESRE